MSDRFHNLRKVLEGGDLLLKFSDGRGLSVHQPQMTLASVQLRLYLEDPDESVDGAAEGTAGSKRRRAEAAGPSSSLLEMRSIPVSGVRGCNMFLCVTAIHSLLSHAWDRNPPIAPFIYARASRMWGQDQVSRSLESR